MEIKGLEKPKPRIFISDNRRGSQFKPVSLDVLPAASEYLNIDRPSNEANFHLTKWSSSCSKEVVDSSSISSTQKVWLLLSSTHDADASPSPKFYLPFADCNLDKSRWNAPIANFGETSYTRNYWEWLETILVKHKKLLRDSKMYDAIYASLFTYDRHGNVMHAFCELWCPSTNTLHTSIGELSISLWDLRSLGGLPIYGSFYDEVIPSAKELYEKNNEGEYLLPQSCKFLFFALGRLANGDPHGVSFDDWVQFWFKGPTRYAPPSQRHYKRRTSAKPRILHNPTGIVNDSCLTTVEGESEPFDILNIPKTLRGEVYLAAFLSCWICKFVLPGREVNCIRPGVFKVASLMACGRKFSLAIPVLASIYNGLNKVSQASFLKECRATFPIHYVYAWIAQYFGTHHENNNCSSVAQMVKFHGENMAKYFSLSEAQEIFGRVDPSSISCNYTAGDVDRCLREDGALSSTWFDYFISLRSNFLTLRQDSTYLIEPYSPHRFCRQFGFCQDVPGDLREKPYSRTLEDVVRLWKSFTRLKTQSSAILPKMSKPLATKEYNTWWDSRSSGIARATCKGKNIAISTPLRPSSTNSNEAPSKEVTAPPTNKILLRIPAVNFPSGVVGSSSAGKRVDTHSSESGTMSDTERDRPWNRPLKKKKTLDGATTSSGLLEGVPSSTMSPQALALHLGALEGSLHMDKIPLLTNGIDSGLPQIDLCAHDDDTAESPMIDLPLTCDPVGEPASILLEASGPSLPSCNERAKPSQRPFAAAVSEFHGVDIIKTAQLQYLQLLWRPVVEKLTRMPTESISAIEEEVLIVFEEMKKMSSIDLSTFKKYLVDLFEGARKYDSLRSSACDLMTKEAHIKSLSRAKSQLMESETSKQTISAKIDALEKKVKELQVELEKSREELEDVEVVCSTRRDEVAAIEDTPFQSDEAVKNLEDMKELLEANKQEMINFKFNV